MRLTEDWEFNVLGIYNYRLPGQFQYYMDFITRQHDAIEGDVCEAGVYEGRSLLATALLLKELGSDKSVIGFDGFAGLPEAHVKDGRAVFSVLCQQGRIAKKHLNHVGRFWEFRQFVMQEEPTVRTVSAYAGDMTDASVEGLQRKIDFLGLDNVELVIGPFVETMTGDYQFMAALLDCDLYKSYEVALPFVWERLATGGYVHLDEYYSLKFPGARIACDEFFSATLAKPFRHALRTGDFERWGVRKTDVVSSG